LNTIAFDSEYVVDRIGQLWDTSTEFGREVLLSTLFLKEIIPDRYILVKGLQLIRDELQFAGHGASSHDGHEGGSNVFVCGADLQVPSVVTTLAYTNCGDRFNAETHQFYQKVMASRFATLSEIGEPKMEAFYPAGGGTDDGCTLAHVTLSHQLDDKLRRDIYVGNKYSFALVNFDLFTHCGKTSESSIEFGSASESYWREKRAACGAIIGTLTSYNSENTVHKRLRADLGEDNFDFLRNHKILMEDGTDITFLVAAAIISIEGMKSTAKYCALGSDNRTLSHITSNCSINKKNSTKGLYAIYLGRATVFQRKVLLQSFGVDARQYSANYQDDKRVQLYYNGSLSFDAVEITY